jgi:hypothetical protein
MEKITVKIKTTGEKASTIKIKNNLMLNSNNSNRINIFILLE